MAAMGLMPASRAEAQRRADRLRALQEELLRLEQEGVFTLTDDQKARLLEHVRGTLEKLAALHDIDTSESQRRLSWGLRIASTLGGLALCAAVVLFFMRYWGYLDTPAQVAIVAAAPVLAVAATGFAARRERTLYFAGLLALVALGCFIQNLVVVGQVFNIAPSESALLAWGGFAILLAYRHGLRLMLVAGTVAWVVWLPALWHGWSGSWWFDVAERPEAIALTGALVFGVPFVVKHPRLADFPPVYRAVGMTAFFLPVLFMAGGAAPSQLPLAQGTVEALCEGIALALSAGAVWFGIRRSSEFVSQLGSAFFAIALYMRLYRMFWDWLPRYLFFALIGAVAVALVLVLKRLRARGQEGGRP